MLYLCYIVFTLFLKWMLHFCFTESKEPTNGNIRYRYGFAGTCYLQICISFACFDITTAVFHQYSGEKLVCNILVV